MHVLAAFFDPNNNGFDLTDLITPLAFVLASVGAWIGVDKWRDEKRREARKRFVAEIEDVVTKATTQIQPDANGGFALADVVRTLEDVSDDLRYLRKRIDTHVDNHDHGKA